MSYPIDTTIPAAGNFPGDDQPLMQTNFANISSYLQVDHTNPSATNAGQHKEVTFASNNVPTPPVSPPVLFTNTVSPSTIPQLFWYSGSSTASSAQYVNSVSGSTFLLGGMIIKWGIGGAIGSTVNFASAFPNAAYSMTVTGSSSLYTGGFTVTALGTGGFTVVRTDGHSGATGYYYIAIGY
jgi:hypothetical protein